MNTTLQNKLSTLPSSPGVYFHKSKTGEIIYVGKAAVLKNRVRQYFQASRDRDPKTEALVRDIVDVEWIEVDSEIDALFLEAELIKRYKPRYNLALRDDKSDLYVRIDLKSEHPVVDFVRRPLDDGAEYFGPFLNGFALRRAIKYLRRVFPFDMKKPSGKRLALDYHLGLSPGLEQGKTSLQDYRQTLRKLMMYLKGERSLLVKQIEKDMRQAAKEQQFERAAVLRNQALALKELNKQIVFSDKEFMDLSKDQALSGLAEMLSLTGLPYRIEGYDISHQSGSDTVASMVVFTNGLPDKTEYRKFKMRIPGNDDFAHMNEVLQRRFSGKHLEDWPKPDLLLIDGGKGQVNAAKKALNDRGVDIPFIGLAKRYETIIVPQADGSLEEVLLSKTSHVIKLLQRIRDESHRFAVSYHTVLKRQRMTVSLLEEIPTVGPATRKKLIKTFGSVRAISQAREAELVAVIGDKKAKLVRQYLRPYVKDQSAKDLTK
jgi:excinuclease ABC subunit C